MSSLNLHTTAVTTQKELEVDADTKRASELTPRDEKPAPEQKAIRHNYRCFVVSISPSGFSSEGTKKSTDTVNKGSQSAQASLHQAAREIAQNSRLAETQIVASVSITLES